MVCRECGKELPSTYTFDICSDCSRKNVIEIFRKDPMVREAYKDTVKEMKKKENVDKAVRDICKFYEALKGGVNHGKDSSIK